jgi:hypothetical protein
MGVLQVFMRQKSGNPTSREAASPGGAGFFTRRISAARTPSVLGVLVKKA